jgi:hypothetical protein
MSNNNDKWESYISRPENDSNPPTLIEVRVLRRYVENFGTPNAVPIYEAGNDIMSLVHETTDMEEPIDKGGRVSWLLWDVGLDMPQHQRAILELVHWIPHIPHPERTRQQIRAGWFKDKMVDWMYMETFWGIWKFYMHGESLEFIFVFSCFRVSLITRLTIVDAVTDDTTIEPFVRNWYSSAEAIQQHEGWLRHNTFFATHLAHWPPAEDSPLFTEIDRAFKMIMLTLENDPDVNEYPLPVCTTLNVSQSKHDESPGN